MNCEECLVLLMGYIDDELSSFDRAAVELHLGSCPHCTRELESFRRLGETLDSMSFVEPPDVVWTNFRKCFYNRAERLTGWVLSVLGVLLLLAYALWTFFSNPTLHWLLKVGVAAVLIGSCLLLISVIRLRLRTSRVDKYREISR